MGRATSSAAAAETSQTGSSSASAAKVAEETRRESVAVTAPKMLWEKIVKVNVRQRMPGETKAKAINDAPKRTK